MDELQALLRVKIEEHMKDNNLNTYSLRGTDIGGVKHATIYKLLKIDAYLPHKNTIKKLLDKFEVKYTETYEGIKLIEDGDSNNN